MHAVGGVPHCVQVFMRDGPEVREAELGHLAEDSTDVELQGRVLPQRPTVRLRR